MKFSNTGSYLAYHLAVIDKSESIDHLLNLVILKRAVRSYLEALNENEYQVRLVRRQKKKAEEQGVHLAFANPFVESGKLVEKYFRSYLTKCGALMIRELDLWQESGATLRDLYNLCNRDYKRATDEIKKEDGEEKFSFLMLFYNLDYPASDRRSIIREDIDAPFTIALAEYEWAASKTPEVRQAYQDSVEEILSEYDTHDAQIYFDGHALHVVDDDGYEYADPDGNESGGEL